MPVQEARNEAHAKDDADGIAALKRRAVAEVRDLLRHADETCQACHAAGTTRRPPETPEPRSPE
jgi:cytochrome c5